MNMRGCVDCRHCCWKTLKCTNPKLGGKAEFYDERDNPLSLCGPEGKLWEKELRTFHMNKNILGIILGIGLFYASFYLINLGGNYFPDPVKEAVLVWWHWPTMILGFILCFFGYIAGLVLILVNAMKIG